MMAAKWLAATKVRATLTDKASTCRGTPDQLLADRTASVPVEVRAAIGQNDSVKRSVRCKKTISRWSTKPFWVTRMGKWDQACNIDQISLSIDKIKFSKPWSIPKPNVSFKLREEVLKTSYPPFRNVIFRADANDVYTNFVHIYTDGS